MRPNNYDISSQVIECWTDCFLLINTGELDCLQMPVPEDYYDDKLLISRPYKVKMQYVQVSNNIDTSIKHRISGQSTLMVKGCIDVCVIC